MAKVQDNKIEENKMITEFEEGKVYRVKIKTWDKMCEEFGCPSLTEESFTDVMEEEIPEGRVVDIVRIDGDDCFVWKDKWNISLDMIEKFLPLEDVENTKAEKPLPEIVESIKNEKEVETFPAPVDTKLIIKQNLALIKPKMINNICHYMKFQLDFDENLSVRFYYRYVDRQDLEAKWCLINHKTKEKGVIDMATAQMLIKDFCKIPAIEIIGRRDSNGSFVKVHVNKETLIKTFEGKDKK